MSVSLAEKKVDRSISIMDMKDGQIAEIVNWIYDEYPGYIVQRFGDGLVRIGHKRGDSWPNIFINLKDKEQINKCRVKILPNGTLLKVENNE